MGGRTHKHRHTQHTQHTHTHTHNTHTQNVHASFDWMHYQDTVHPWYVGPAQTPWPFFCADIYIYRTSLHTIPYIIEA